MMFRDTNVFFLHFLLLLLSEYSESTAKLEWQPEPLCLLKRRVHDTKYQLQSTFFKESTGNNNPNYLIQELTFQVKLVFIRKITMVLRSC